MRVCLLVAGFFFTLLPSSFLLLLLTSFALSFLDFARSAALAGSPSSSSASFFSSSSTATKPLLTATFVDEALAPTRAFAARARALADLLVASAQFEALGALPPAHAPPLRGLAAEAAALVAAVRERASASCSSRGRGENSAASHGNGSSSSKNGGSLLRFHHLLLNPKRDLDRDLLEAAVGVHSLEMKALGAVDEALAAAPSVEAATTVLASVVKAASVDRVTTSSSCTSSPSSSSSASASTSRSRLKASLSERLRPLLLRYAEHVEGTLRNEYESGKADPRPPPGAPRGAGGVLWARGLLERVEGPMKR